MIKKAVSEYYENVLNELVSNIRELLSRGYKQKDIAILVRSKGVIQDIADKFKVSLVQM